MKYLLLITFCLFFTSCQKEYCWQCHTTDVWRYSNGTSTTINADHEVCGKTQSEMNDYQKKGNYTETDASQGFTIVHYMSCKY